MSNPVGIDVEINDDADGIDLYVNYEGLEALRDNTSRPYSQFFDSLITQVDEEQARKYDAPDQEPLPSL